MNWTVVASAALRQFVVDNAGEAGGSLRIQVQAWILWLSVAGPPDYGVYDSFRDLWIAKVPGTAVWAEYLVLPFLPEPAIVVRTIVTDPS